MFLKTPQTFTLTLLLYVTLVSILTTSSTARIQQRDHANLRRLIKRRSPEGFSPLVPVNGVGAAPPTDLPSSTPSLTNSVQTSTSLPTTSSGLPASESSATPSVSEPNFLSLHSSTVSESTTSGSSSLTTTLTTQSATLQTPNITIPPEPSIVTVKPTLTQTKSIDAAETPSEVALPQSGVAKTKSTTLTVIIVVAASVAAVVILWTIFRKWKLGRSAKFDKRLNPIDWQPTSAEDGAIPGVHRRLSGSSFYSGSAHGNSAGVEYGISDHAHSSDTAHPLPNHDFTAGPSTLAPIGGYADLARGPSPQPQMHQMSHAPHFADPRYDVGVPLHHQAPVSKEAYDPLGRRY